MVGWMFHGAQGGGCMLREVERSSCEVYHHWVVWVYIILEMEVEV